MTGAAKVPGMPGVTAREVSAPPRWALLQRHLISVMEEAAEMMVRKYAERGGLFIFADDLDDFYERTYNWGLFYAMGADERVLELALQQWNANTRLFDDRLMNRGESTYNHGSALVRFKHSIHNEYYSLANPGDAEWHHKGEGNQAFYDLGVADPTISENARRAKRFAAMYIGEDPEAPNYDPKHRVLRSPAQTSQGPWLKATANHAKSYLQGGSSDDPNWTPRSMGVRASLYPVVKHLEPDWYEEPKRRREIVELFEKIVLSSDSPNNLAATGLVTNAYLYTGEEKYKRWVLEYTEAWLERIKANNGIVPDNVGPTGKVGEHREGQWWGGLYGWNHYQGFNIIFDGLATAAECAVLLSGDLSYLDLLRSQIQMLLDNSITREDGQLLVPTRYTPEGWGYTKPEVWGTGPAPVRERELAHLYHASMLPEDYDLIAKVRAGDVERDWNGPIVGGQIKGGQIDLARFQFYDGRMPDWPEKVLEAELDVAVTTYDSIRNDTRDMQTMVDEIGSVPPNPVFTVGLTQVTMGTPQTVYNGGLLRATVRYFDTERARPGLPPDVAALVDELRSEGVGIQLVNLNRRETRSLIVQAGAFGEHQFTNVRYLEGGESRVVPVGGKYFSVELPPSASIRIEAGMRRFVNDPSYAFPWHGDKVPVPFQ